MARGILAFEFHPRPIFLYYRHGRRPGWKRRPPIRQRGKTLRQYYFNPRWLGSRPGDCDLRVSRSKGLFSRSRQESPLFPVVSAGETLSQPLFENQEEMEEERINSSGLIGRSIDLSIFATGEKKIRERGRRSISLVREIERDREREKRRTRYCSV